MHNNTGIKETGRHYLHIAGEHVRLFWVVFIKRTWTWFLGCKHKPLSFTSDNCLHEIWIMVFTDQHIMSDFHVELVLLRCQNLRDGFYWHSTYAQIFHSNALLILTPISCIGLHDELPWVFVEPSPHFLKYDFISCSLSSFDGVSS